ncbi:hypothetical protein NE237_026225 [Protea cynaroides]|uniref:Exostosin GT47 domain-containing protein n=1 Tax=Protea cynaroides TaxID=273540 RepID=A0A9Q0H4L4_9MAGN|nr:hypothetical protein NE237_026225 [Protea cynaroides]
MEGIEVGRTGYGQSACDGSGMAWRYLGGDVSTGGEFYREIINKKTPASSPAPTPIPLPKPSFNPTIISNTSATDHHIRVKNNVERIEEGLARARAAIRQAIISRNYTSDREELFIPRGSIYRNPYEFHQSHIEMVKRFKIWTYREGEPPLVHDGPLHYIYSIEGQFIDEMERGLRPFAAHHPNEAHTFFLPFSIANAVHYLYRPLISYARDPLQHFVIDYVNIISKKYPYWNRSSGADHFMVSCHDWAPDINPANPKLFEHFVRVMCNANTSEGFIPRRDVSLAETYLLPGRGIPKPGQGQSPGDRLILAFFAGGEHGYVRKLLLDHWKDKDNEIQVHEYLPNGQNYSNFMVQTKYCLCPSGYEVASPRILESIYSEDISSSLSPIFDAFVLKELKRIYMYNRLQFNYGWYFTFVQGFVYLGLLYLQGFTTKQMVNPWKTYVKLSAVLMGSHELTKGSLAFVNYLAQFMFKSTKVC